MSTNLKTATQVLNAAARSLGLISADIADPYGSSNENILRLTTILNECGNELAKDHDWQLLRHEHTFSTANGTAEYALPTSPIFDRFVEGTFWDRTNDLPGYPISEQRYQALTARDASLSSTIMYFIRQNSLVLYPTPSATNTVAYAYQSAYWAGGTTEPTADTASAASDKIWYDHKLITDLLKLRFKQSVGMPSDAEEATYNKTLSNCRSQESEAPSLRLHSPRARGVFDPLPVDTLDVTS